MHYVWLKNTTKGNDNMKTKELRERYETELLKMLKDANTVVEDATKALEMRQADVETASATLQKHQDAVNGAHMRFNGIGKLIRKLAAQGAPDVQEVGGAIETLDEYVNHRNAIPEATKALERATDESAAARTELERAKRIYAALEELNKA